jgi:proteasome lid subunit RPN8/RPN11
MRRPLRYLVIATLGLPMHLGGARAGAARCPPIVLGAADTSLDELAARTLHDLLDEGGRYESGGFLIERNGAYHASEPVTQNARRAVNYCIVLPRGARLAGIYHTHVGSSTLSARDRSNAERAGVPSYIGTIRGRSVLVYDARRREVRPLDDRANSAATTARARASDNAERNTVRERLVALKRHALALLDDVSRLF